jgi:hypothetical protein
MHFSLSWLFLAILLIAVSVVALLNANEYWVSASRAALVVLLPLTIVGGIFSKGRKRAFWFGFAIVGWTVFLSAGLNDYPPFNEARSEKALQWLHSLIVRLEPVSLEGWDRITGARLTGTGTIDVPAFSNFKVVFHCAASLLLGVLGGYAAMWFYLRRERAILVTRLKAQEKKKEAIKTLASLLPNQGLGHPTSDHRVSTTKADGPGGEGDHDG